jgi:arylsulfatase A-like enzyme
VIRYPGQVPRGVRVTTPVTLRDIPATITDLAGLGENVRFPGHSLTVLWEGAAGAPNAVSPLLASFSGPPGLNEPVRSILVWPYHLIQHHDGGEELYDVDRDPFEGTDLLSTGEGRAVAPRLRQALDSLHRQGPGGRRAPGR